MSLTGTHGGYVRRVGVEPGGPRRVCGRFCAGSVGTDAGAGHAGLSGAYVLTQFWNKIVLD